MAQQSDRNNPAADTSRSNCKTITIGGPTSWQPISYIAKDGRQTGLGIDIITEYAKRNNLDVRVDIEMPWARTLDLLFQGEIDATAGAYFKTERQRLYHYSDPFYEDDIMVFQHVDRRFGYRQISDLRGIAGHARMVAALETRSIAIQAKISTLFILRQLIASLTCLLQVMSIMFCWVAMMGWQRFANLAFRAKSLLLIPRWRVTPCI